MGCKTSDFLTKNIPEVLGGIEDVDDNVVAPDGSSWLPPRFRCSALSSWLCLLCVWTESLLEVDFCRRNSNDIVGGVYLNGKIISAMFSEFNSQALLKFVLTVFRLLLFVSKLLTFWRFSEKKFKSMKKIASFLKNKYQQRPISQPSIYKRVNLYQTI